MREAQIEAWVTKKIRDMGGASYKWTSPGNPGVPDRIYLLPGGRIVFAELKTSEGVLSNAQRLQIRKIRELGFTCEVIHGKDEAEKFISRLSAGGDADEVYPARVSKIRDPEIDGAS